KQWLTKPIVVMRTFTYLSVCSLLPLLFAPAPLKAGGIPAKTLKEVKAASVYIKVELSSFLAPGKVIPITGSVFLLHVADGAGFIATNNHVVTPLPGETPLGHPKVVFHSGTPNERTVEAQIVASDPFRDLAILKVTGFKNLPRPLPMNPAIAVTET